MSKTYINVRIAMGFLLLACVFVLSRQAGNMASGRAVTVGHKKPVVVIDVGHGGNDPGKIGVDGSLEKDINLAIALKLKTYLEAADVDVILTREDDRGLYTASDSHKKSADMRNRCNMINELKPAAVVSIHQNSFHQEGISGAQMFYYKGSAKGRQLGEIIQKRFDYVLGEDNQRVAKANDSYYLLLHVKSPIVIAECGFLTNWQEAASLNTKEYQDRMAWTIHVGIIQYLNEVHD